MYVDEGIIKAVSKNISCPAEQIIDASGKYVIPGGIDVHTHLNLHTGNFVTKDDFYTGTVAAAFGGNTCVVDHIGFEPKGCNLKHQIKVYHEYADDKAVIDYSFHGVIQHVNDNIIDEMESMVKDEGISSFKIYLTYDFKLPDEDILKVFRKSKKLGAMIAIHCENDGIINFFRKLYLSQGCTEPIYHSLSRPEEAEVEAVN